MKLHHVQVACPPAGEEGARRFYGDGLGMTQVPKPVELAKRGGCWFRAHDENGAVRAEIHVGVDEPFVPARKAHPALILDSVDVLEETAHRLQELGFEVDWTERHSFAGYQRLHTRDTHGNRVELLA